MDGGRAPSTIIDSLQLLALINISPRILIWGLFRVSFHLSSPSSCYECGNSHKPCFYDSIQTADALPNGDSEPVQCEREKPNAQMTRHMDIISLNNV